MSTTALAPRCLLGATGLMLALFALPSGAEPVTTEPSPDTRESRRHFDIPRQPLASALLSFGSQSGLQVSVDSRLLDERLSAGIQGTMSSEEALQRLLDGSGLGWRYSGPSALVLTPLTQSALNLANTVVSTRTSPHQGETTLDRKTIDALPGGNGDITSLLKIHPNVQFDNNQLSSKNPGEIAPANISINGAKYYQNAFLVDGMSMNNDINPGDSQHNLVNSVPGRSQGLALDTELLEDIKVYDSNIGARYGGFNGGVVAAETRQPTKDLHGKVSYQTTRSSWTRYHVDEDEQAKFDAASSGSSYAYQPDFVKHFVRATLEGHLTENLGLLANVTQKTSTIPVNVFSSNNDGKAGYTAQQEDQERKSQSVFLKAVYKASERLDLEGSFTSSPEEATYFRDNALDTGYTIKSGGTLLNFKADYQADSAKITQQFAWSRMENSRDSDADDWNNWVKNDVKNWGVSTPQEGGYGDIDQTQDSYEYKLEAAWDAMDFYGSRHSLTTGMELKYQAFSYERLTASDVNVYGALPGTTTCASASSLGGDRYCDSDARQYVRQLTRYAAGDFDFNVNSAALYVQDEIEIGRVTLRPGVRLDTDDYMQQTTVAPRLALEWDVFGDQRTRISAGRNRYYGRNSAYWALREGVNSLQTRYARTAAGGAWTKTSFANDAQFNKLDIPYDDEWTLGITQQVRDLELALKWVRREGRDQVMQKVVDNSGDPSLTSSYDVYTNDGKSNTEVVTLTLTPLLSYDVWGTRNSGQLAADWTHFNTTHTDYSEEFEDDDYVRYNGQIMHISELPPSNYNHDWTYRLTTTTEIPAWNLGWTNFFRYRAGIDTLKTRVGKVDGYTEYFDKSYGNALTWDMRLAWEIPTGRDQAAFVNVDVYNVTDRVIASGDTSATAAINSAIYETGRQFWLEVGYRF
ncbi:TonB-dependent receptor [Pseudomonas alkylphenolica]|uniref:TonB-dependent receptor n=1 Tax=Pseudomonas alkylphenolica TaxID=237609 RepID=UPI0018D67EAC|nr:TonB-dependent receptor [Pseudomonas alkylphenolica]MBH3428999.1 TonB-dependent receptor [Pseudomonas alkylphenolica]